MSTKVTTGKLKQSHHCTNRAAFCAASMSRLPAWLHGLVGDHADRSPVEPPETGDHVGRVAVAELEEGVLVEHVRDDGPDVVRRGRPRRHRRGGAGRRPVDGVVGVLERRILEMVRRQVATAALRARPSRRPRRRRRMVATPLSRSCTVAPPSRSPSIGHTGERDHDVGSGHVRERVVGHDHVVGDAEQQRGSGHRGARPAASTIGTTPDASLSALATRPHACSEATPSDTSAPELAMRPDDRQARARPRGGRPARWPRPRRCRWRRGASRRRG